MKRVLSFLSVFLLLFPVCTVCADTIEDFETGDLSGFAWTVAGDGIWLVSDAYPYNGEYAVRSPHLAGDQEAVLETMVNCESGDIDFWSFINGKKYASSFSFYIDDSLQISFSPTTYTPTDASSGSGAYSPYTQSRFSVSPGMHIFTWIFETNQHASNLDFAWLDDISFPLSDQPYLMDNFESGGLYRLPWETEGDGKWYVGKDMPSRGYYAVQSPVLESNQSAALKLDNKRCDAGNLSFWMTVSSEKDGDYLRFYIDDNLRDEWSGTIDYTRVSYTIKSGTHSFKWEYQKDDMDSGGAETTLDSVSLDTITFPGTANDAPETPTASVKEAQDGVVDSDSVTLQGSDYSDADNEHLRTYWLVRRADQLYRTFDESQTAETDDDSFTHIAYSGDELTTHTVEGLIPGMRYFFKVGYTDAVSKETSWSQEYSFVRANTSDDTTPQVLSVPPGAYMEDFRMISFIRWPANSNSAAVFAEAMGGPYDTTKFRIGRYDPLSGAYIELGDNLDVLPGRAYWVFARKGINVTDNGVPATLEDEVEVPLDYNNLTQDGWNMIASPNNADYSWEDIMVVQYYPSGEKKSEPVKIADLEENNDLISTKLWRWKDGAYSSNTDQLLVNEGYWVKARIKYIALVFPESARIATTDTTTAENRIKSAWQWVNKKILTPRIAVAEEETPPLPMGVSRSEDRGGNSCFISTLVP